MGENLTLARIKLAWGRQHFSSVVTSSPLRLKRKNLAKTKSPAKAGKKRTQALNPNRLEFKWDGSSQVIWMEHKWTPPASFKYSDVRGEKRNDQITPLHQIVSGSEGEFWQLPGGQKPSCMWAYVPAMGWCRQWSWPTAPPQPSWWARRRGR